MAFGVIEVAVQRAGINDRRVRAGRPQFVADVEPVGVEPDLDALVGGHVLQPGRVAVDRQTLVGVVEVAIVEGIAHRQPGDVGRRQLLGIGLPLLSGVVLHERLVERSADQRDRLLFEVLRILGVDLGGLLGDQRPGFVGGEVPAEELGHQAQPHRELVGLAVVHGEDAVLVTGEFGELPHVVPYPLVRGVEEVGTVLVHLDAGLRLSLGVSVPADMRAPVDDEHPLAELRSHALGDRQTEESGADDIEVKATGRRSHRLPRVSDCETAARFGGGVAPGSY